MNDRSEWGTLLFSIPLSREKTLRIRAGAVVAVAVALAYGVAVALVLGL